MKNLLIIGARGFGRDIFHVAQECRGYNTDFIIKGFLDDKPDALNDFKNYPPIIDTVENYNIQKDDVFICALGDVASKKKFSVIILEKGGEFISLIHNVSSINETAKIGKGCIIRYNALIACEAVIGDFTTIQSMSIVGHDAKVGKWCYIDSFSDIGGGAELEDEVTVYPNAVVHPRKKVGEGAVVGAGAVVIRNVKNNTTVCGNPAVRL